MPGNSDCAHAMSLFYEGKNFATLAASALAWAGKSPWGSIERHGFISISRDYLLKALESYQAACAPDSNANGIERRIKRKILGTQRISLPHVNRLYEQSFHECFVGIKLRALRSKPKHPRVLQ
jgi:hypothetical protein